MDNAPHLSDLSPLISCTMMKSLDIRSSSVTGISVVSLMPFLEVLACQKDPGRPLIKNLSPLSSCPRLKLLWLNGNRELKDLSPLSACTDIETLSISDCPLITSLAPLSTLSNLKTLYCWGIHPKASSAMTLTLRPPSFPLHHAHDHALGSRGLYAAQMRWILRSSGVGGLS